MASCPSRRTSGPVVPRPTSPTSAVRFASASTAAAFCSHSSPFFDYPHHQNPSRSASPTRINLMGTATAVRSQVLSRRPLPPPSSAVSRRTCMCSPTTHPGSFRCNLHKGFRIRQRTQAAAGAGTASSPSNRLNMRRSAMTNSLVRIGTVEGDLVKRALTALIRPSSHQQRRRAGFQPRPSRLSVMSKADDSGS